MGNQGTLLHGNSQKHGGTGNQRAGGEICRRQEGWRATGECGREAAANEHQVVAEERSPSPVGEESRAAPPSNTDPADQLREAADADQRQPAAAEAGSREAAHRSLEFNQHF